MNNNARPNLSSCTNYKTMIAVIITCMKIILETILKKKRKKKRNKPKLIECERGIWEESEITVHKVTHWNKISRGVMDPDKNQHFTNSKGNTWKDEKKNVHELK